MGQESWTQMYSSGMNSTPAMALLSPGPSGTPPRSPLSPKKSTFQSLGSLTSGVMSPSLSKGSSYQARKASIALNSSNQSIMTSSKLWQKASISRLAEEFFWIGGSVVAQPTWRLGQMGKTCKLLMNLQTQKYCRKRLLSSILKYFVYTIFDILNILNFNPDISIQFSFK